MTWSAMKLPVGLCSFAGLCIRAVYLRDIVSDCSAYLPLPALPLAPRSLFRRLREWAAQAPVVSCGRGRQVRTLTVSMYCTPKVRYKTFGVHGKRPPVSICAIGFPFPINCLFPPKLLRVMPRTRFFGRPFPRRFAP